MFALKMITW